MARELEVKLEVDSHGAEALRKDVSLSGVCASKQSLLSVYFDTNSGDVRKAGYSLRVRRTTIGFLQTIKPIVGGTGLFDREEWEGPVPKLWPSAHAARDSPLRSLLTPGVIRDVIPVVRSEVERTVWIVEYDHSKLEVCLDDGTIRGGSNAQRMLEVEIELIEGNAASVINFVLSLSKRVPVRIGVLSKVERGFAVAQGILSRPFKPGRMKLDATMKVADGLAEIARSCLKHMRLNESLLIARRDSGALREASIAIWRLRHAFSIFGPVIDDDYLRFVHNELQWFGKQLEAAQHIDLVLKRTGSDHPEQLQIGAARAEAYTKVIRAIDSQRFRDLLLGLVSWLEIGGWRQTVEANSALPVVARQELNRLLA